MRNIFICALILCISLISGCHKKTEVILINQIGDARDYEETLQEWTEKDKYYYFTNVEFFVSTTFKSWPLRLAYLKEYAKKFKISSEEQLEMYKKELSDYKNYNEFFITVFSSRKDVNKLEDEKMWRLYLKDANMSSGRLTPESIKKLKVDDNLKYFYPHVDPWTSNYNVKFSRVLNDASGLNMRIDDFKTLSLMLATMRGEKTFTFGVTREKIKEIEEVSKETLNVEQKEKEEEKSE